MIRQAGPQDVRFLRDMLKHAYHWRLNADPDLPVARYVNNWGRPGDAGIIAWENGPIGAAWYRIFKEREPGFVTCILRPATVCGYAPRQRLDPVGDLERRLLVRYCQITSAKA